MALRERSFTKRFAWFEATSRQRNSLGAAHQSENKSFTAGLTSGDTCHGGDSLAHPVEDANDLVCINLGGYALELVGNSSFDAKYTDGDFNTATYHGSFSSFALWLIWKDMGNERASLKFFIDDKMFHNAIS